MSDIIAAPPGWYFCRVVEGDPHLQRYPVAAWRVTTGEGSTPLLAKPGEPGLVPPTPDDRAALVGLVPPDREYQSYFSTEDVQEAVLRLHRFRHPRQPDPRDPQGDAVVREVRVPGVGPIGVRDARPPSQQGGSADWIRRAWGGDPGQGRLGSGSS